MLTSRRGKIMALEGKTRVRSELFVEDQNRYMLPVKQAKRDWTVLRTTE